MLRPERLHMPPSNDGRHITCEGARLVLRTFVHQVSGWQLSIEQVLHQAGAGYGVNLDDHDLLQLHRMTSAALVSKGLLKP